MAQVMVTETCRWCGAGFEMRVAERRRQRKHGVTNFFCSRSCACSYGNSLRDDLTRIIVKRCPVCGADFETRADSHEATFCSRSCASAGSVTPYRSKRAAEVGRAVMAEKNPEMIASGLRVREWWRYDDLDVVLTVADVAHQFEYPITDCGTTCIYDLALIDRQILVEFDGPYHNGDKQKLRDEVKELVAQNTGWQLVRVRVPTGAAVPADAIKV